MRSIPSLVVPGLEVTDLSATDAEHNAQNFHVGHPLRQFRVKTCSTLLDKAKVKARGVGDRLNEVRIAGVSISSGYRRMLPNSQ